MNKLQINIFHLRNAKIALSKTLAFCGLVSILLTSACSPSSSDSSKIPTPKFDDESVQESREGIQVLPQALPETKPSLQPSVKTDETTPEPSKPTPAPVPNVTTPSPITATSEATEKNAADRLTGNYVWATMPTFVDTYKDSSGQVHEHFLVSSGDSQELKDLLAKMRDELVAGNRPKIEIKEQGTCGNSEEQKESSTKSCDTSAPICVSLEAAKDLRPLIMREFARQHCASEALAQQVQKYYELPSVKNFNATSGVASLLNRVRISLVYLQAALTTGVTPNAGTYAQKIDTQEDICNIIMKGASQAQKLQDQVASAGELVDILNGMKAFCDNSSLDRQGLLQSLNKAIPIYDQVAQKFSQDSGMIVLDFSKHLWAH